MHVGEGSSKDKFSTRRQITKKGVISTWHRCFVRELDKLVKWEPLLSSVLNRILIGMKLELQKVS